MHYSGPEAAAITWAFTGIMVIIWSLRIFTRLRIARNPGWEDALITLSVICSLGFSVTIQLQIETGMGQHVWTIAPDEEVRSLKAFYASILLYNGSLLLTKVSILKQYLRIFPMRSFRIAAYIILAIVLICSAWAIFADMFLCQPVAFFWDSSIPGGHCMNELVVWFVNAGLNISTDLAIIILPINSIRHLNLPKRQKRLLIIVFGLAGFVCIVSVLRLQSLVQISNSKDPTWDNGPAATWSSIEVNVGIVCACLPPMRPLLSRIAPHILPGTRANYGGGSNGRPNSQSRRAEHGGTANQRSLSVSGRRSIAYILSSKSSKSGACTAGNESEEEMIGLKGVSDIYTGTYEVGVQPARVTASTPGAGSGTSSMPPHVRSAAQNGGGMALASDKASETLGIAVPMAAAAAMTRSTSSIRGGGSAHEHSHEFGSPAANEIQVTTRMQQSVEVHDPEKESQHSQQQQQNPYTYGLSGVTSEAVPMQSIRPRQNSDEFDRMHTADWAR